MRFDLDNGVDVDSTSLLVAALLGGADKQRGLSEADQQPK